MTRSRASRAVPPAPISTDAPLAELVSCSELPWFPFLVEGMQLKLCRVSRSTGAISLLARVVPGTEVYSHYNHGLAVVYTISGQWRYREAEWLATSGDVVVAPAGSTRTFETVGAWPAEVFIQLAGPVEFRDANDQTICIENAETLHGRYLAHCALHGIPAVDLTGA